MRWRLAIATTVALVAAACGTAVVAPSGEPAATVVASDATADTEPATSPHTTTTPPPDTAPADTAPPDTGPTTTGTPARTFTLVVTGDVLLHSRVNSVAAANAAGTEDRQYDYRPMLEPIRPLVEAADRAICHLEVNLSADGTRLSSYPSFRAPGQVAFDLSDIGYDACTLASNHILDKGVHGVAETLGVLDAAGLEAIGAARSPAEADSQRLSTVNGVTVAHLAYAYWFNGIPLPADAPWTSNPIDEDRILADAARARRDGAEYTVVSLHWGQQYQHEPDRQQRELGPRLLASPDIDLIVGHHAHVVQPIERIDGEWLIHGQGNLLSNSTQAVRRDELLVTVTVTEATAGHFHTDLAATPLHLDHATLTVHPSDPALRPPSIGSELSDALDASWERVLAVLADGPDTLVIGPAADDGPTGDGRIGPR